MNLTDKQKIVLDAAWDESEHGQCYVVYHKLRKSLAGKLSPRSISSVVGTLAQKGLIRSGGVHGADAPIEPDLCVTCATSKLYGGGESTACFGCEICLAALDEM